MSCTTYSVVTIENHQCHVSWEMYSLYQIWVVCIVSCTPCKEKPFRKGYLLRTLLLNTGYDIVIISYGGDVP